MPPASPQSGRDQQTPPTVQIVVDQGKGAADNRLVGELSGDAHVRRIARLARRRWGVDCGAYRAVDRELMRDVAGRCCRLSNCMAERRVYLQSCRILIKMADAFVSSSWRILKLDGCPTSYRRSTFDVKFPTTATHSLERDRTPNSHSRRLAT
jgi:hypothetical protein